MAPLALDELEGSSESSLFPLTEVEKMRYGMMAKSLEDQRMQAYIEANFGIQALRLLQVVVPFLAGITGV